MKPFLLLLAPFVAREAGLSWDFGVKTTKSGGHYEVVGKAFRGEVFWFVAPKGRYDAEPLYQRDTERTKEADQTKAFAHERSTATLAGMPAIGSDQTYLWDGERVASRCVYCAQGARAWVVRLWWPRDRASGSSEADRFLKSLRRL